LHSTGHLHSTGPNSTLARNLLTLIHIYDSVVFKLKFLYKKSLLQYSLSIRYKPSQTLSQFFMSLPKHQ